MVNFINSYLGPMDRQYGAPSSNDESTNDVGVGIKDIGESVVMGVGAQNLNALAAKVRTGVRHMEITFSGVGGGSGQSQTPDQYGTDKRIAMRELAKINEMDLTTHASFNVMGLAGMDQQGNFSADQRKMNIDEIKRAINFATDVSRGGSVVVHTGEFYRPVSEEDWAKDPRNPDKLMFMMNPDEPKNAVISVVDDRTGQVVTRARKNQEVSRPIWNKYDPEINPQLWGDHKGEAYKQGEKIIKPGDYVDYEGNLIEDPYNIQNGRVPVYDPKEKRFKMELVKWDTFEKEGEEQGITPEQAFARATLDAQIGHARGWALQYGEHFQENVDALKKLRDALDDAKQQESDAKKTGRLDDLRRAAGDMASKYAPGRVTSKGQLPSEMIQEAINSVRKSIEHEYQASSSQEQQARDNMELRDHVISSKEYGLKKSYESYAEAGMHAFLRTKKDHLERPVFIAVENLFPESYGGHPDEIIKLVKNSRKVMADKLYDSQQAGSREEATKIAEKHIQITLDTNHLYMWKKYWNSDPHKSLQENEDAFKGWYLGQVKKLAESKMIGNVHLVDGYGYQDDHLSPGDGLVPVKEVVKLLKENGYNGKLVVEAGAEATVGSGHFEGVSKAWSMFDSSIYSAHVYGGSEAPRDKWSDIKNSYFGRVEPPYFVVGSYAPSQEWSLWSQVNLE